MIEFLKKTWNNYKVLIWWKKLLLAIPLLALAVVCFCLFFINKNPSGSFKQIVDEQLKENKDKIKQLDKQDNKVVKEQKKLKETIRDNEEEAIKLIKKIEKATNNNDLEELEKLRQEINNV